MSHIFLFSSFIYRLIVVKILLTIIILQKKKKSKRKKYFETLARVFSSPIWVRGYAPETSLFLFPRACLSFLFKKIGPFITAKNIFILYFVFHYFFETFCTFVQRSHFFFPMV
ncbi:hypothetical protein BREVNS_2322 [Brevinematales bacterium NS]|nr:hypothetical protein BREVNS_2322 [Brevinematales bacterium NS]